MSDTTSTVVETPTSPFSNEQTERFSAWKSDFSTVKTLLKGHAKVGESLNGYVVETGDTETFDTWTEDADAQQAYATLVKLQSQHEQEIQRAADKLTKERAQVIEYAQGRQNKYSEAELKVLRAARTLIRNKGQVGGQGESRLSLNEIILDSNGVPVQISISGNRYEATLVMVGQHKNQPKGK